MFHHWSRQRKIQCHNAILGPICYILLHHACTPPSNQIRFGCCFIDLPFGTDSLLRRSKTWCQLFPRGWKLILPFRKSSCLFHFFHQIIDPFYWANPAGQGCNLDWMELYNWGTYEMDSELQKLLQTICNEQCTKKVMSLWNPLSTNLRKQDVQGTLLGDKSILYCKQAMSKNAP